MAKPLIAGSLRIQGTYSNVARARQALPYGPWVLMPSSNWSARYTYLTSYLELRTLISRCVHAAIVFSTRSQHGRPLSLETYTAHQHIEFSSCCNRFKDFMLTRAISASHSSGFDFRRLERPAYYGPSPVLLPECLETVLSTSRVGPLCK